METVVLGIPLVFPFQSIVSFLGFGLIAGVLLSNRGTISVPKQAVAMVFIVGVISGIIVLHELIRSTVAITYGYSIVEGGMNWQGFYLKTSDLMRKDSGINHLMINISGPLFYFSIFTFSRWIGKKYDERTWQIPSVIGALSLALFLFNLLPIPTANGVTETDGARAGLIVLTYLFGEGLGKLSLSLLANINLGLIMFYLINLPDWFKNLVGDKKK